MKARIRWTILTVAATVLAICIVLLLNFTAPNPTGRRYSSEWVLTERTQGVTSKQIGDSGEDALSTDLGLPNNNEVGQCLCNNSGVQARNPCRVCVANIDMINPESTHRVPDFVSDTLIAESKNRKSFPKYPSDIPQLQDFVTGAKALGLPLWVFVRVNTEVDPEIYTLVAETGGGVVHYFAYEGYIDPITVIALIGALLAAAVIAFIIWRGLRETFHMSQIYRDVPEEDAPPGDDAPPKLPRKQTEPLSPSELMALHRRKAEDNIQKSERSVEDAEEFMDRVNGKIHIDIEVDDE